MQFHAVLNRDGGTLRTTDLPALVRQAEDIFSAAGHQLTHSIVGAKKVEVALAAAAANPEIDAILAGGGDGTISAAAATAFEAGKTIGVLPAGTMNLFARALGMPLDLVAALEAIAAGEVRQIDIATANGRPFVHQFGVGVHARLVRIRDGMVYNSRIGKMVASLRSIGAAAIDPPRFEVEILRGDQREVREASGIAISNNPLNDEPVPVAERLDTGRLGVYVAAGLSTGALLGLAFDVLTGRWRANPQVSEAEVAELVLHFPRSRRGMHAVIDGELIRLERKVTLRAHPGALSVIRPAQDNAAP